MTWCTKKTSGHNWGVVLFLFKTDNIQKKNPTQIFTKSDPDKATSVPQEHIVYS